MQNFYYWYRFFGHSAALWWNLIFLDIRLTSSNENIYLFVTNFSSISYHQTINYTLILLSSTKNLTPTLKIIDITFGSIRSSSLSTMVTTTQSIILNVFFFLDKRTQKWLCLVQHCVFFLAESRLLSRQEDLLMELECPSPLLPRLRYVLNLSQL